MKEIIRHKIKHNLKRIETSIKWVLFAIISGVVAGGAGTLFYFGMTLVTLIRTKHPWLIFLLPFGGLVIVGCYHYAEIWSEENWQKQIEEEDADAIRRELEALGL